MDRVKTGLATFAIAAMILVGITSFTPDRANASGVWAAVCCGPLCTGGEDYCIGSGEYTCCKGGGSVE